MGETPLQIILIATIVGGLLWDRHYTRVILIICSTPRKTDFLASFQTCRSRGPGEAAPGSAEEKHRAGENPGGGGRGSVPQGSRKSCARLAEQPGSIQKLGMLGAQERHEEEAGGQARSLGLRDLRNCSFQKMTAQ